MPIPVYDVGGTFQDSIGDFIGNIVYHAISLTLAFYICWIIFYCICSIAVTVSIVIYIFSILTLFLNIPTLLNANNNGSNIMPNSLNNMPHQLQNMLNGDLTLSTFDSVFAWIVTGLSTTVLITFFVFLIAKGVIFRFNAYLKKTYNWNINAQWMYGANEGFWRNLFKGLVILAGTILLIGLMYAIFMIIALGLSYFFATLFTSFFSGIFDDTNNNAVISSGLNSNFSNPAGSGNKYAVPTLFGTELGFNTNTQHLTYTILPVYIFYNIFSYAGFHPQITNDGFGLNICNGAYWAKMFGEGFFGLGFILLPWWILIGALTIYVSSKMLNIILKAIMRIFVLFLYFLGLLVTAWYSLSDGGKTYKKLMASTIKWWLFSALYIVEINLICLFVFIFVFVAKIISDDVANYWNGTSFNIPAIKTNDLPNKITKALNHINSSTSATYTSSAIFSSLSNSSSSSNSGNGLVNNLSGININGTVGWIFSWIGDFTGIYSSIDFVLTFLIYGALFSAIAIANSLNNKINNKYFGQSDFAYNQIEAIKSDAKQLTSYAVASTIGMVGAVRVSQGISNKLYGNKIKRAISNKYKAVNAKRLNTKTAKKYTKKNGSNDENILMYKNKNGKYKQLGKLENNNLFLDEKQLKGLRLRKVKKALKDVNNDPFNKDKQKELNSALSNFNNKYPNALTFGTTSFNIKIPNGNNNNTSYKNIGGMTHNEWIGFYQNQKQRQIKSVFDNMTITNPTAFKNLITKHDLLNSTAINEISWDSLKNKSLNNAINDIASKNNTIDGTALKNKLSDYIVNNVHGSIKSGSGKQFWKTKSNLSDMLQNLNYDAGIGLDLQSTSLKFNKPKTLNGLLKDKTLKQEAKDVMSLNAYSTRHAPNYVYDTKKTYLLNQKANTEIKLGLTQMANGLIATALFSAGSQKGNNISSKYKLSDYLVLGDIISRDNELKSELNNINNQISNLNMNNEVNNSMKEDLDKFYQKWNKQ